MDGKQENKNGWDKYKEINLDIADWKKIVDIILDLVCQYANKQGRVYYSGGLSVLEDAFIWLIGYGYADGNANHIKLTDKANGGDLYTNYERKKGV